MNYGAGQNLVKCILRAIQDVVLLDSPSSLPVPVNLQKYSTRAEKSSLETPLGI